MIKLLLCEYKKTRRLYILLTAFAITAIQIVWSAYGNYNNDVLKNGYMMFLYELPLVNAIFLPIMTIVISSRLCDTEHKGLMLKHLCAIAPKGKIYDAKLIFGLSIMIVCIIISWVSIIIFGKYIGFMDKFPLKLYLLYLLFTTVPTIALYIFQHILSLCFKNQAIGLFTGVLGEFIGIFSMFLPQFPMLRRLTPWGYYGVLQFVGMFGWSKETRMKNIYFQTMDIDWTFFIVIVLISFVTYLIGKRIFIKKEV